MKLDRYLPWMIVLLAVALGWAATMRQPVDDQAFDLDALGRLPVSGEGRVKPLDTVARTSLMIVSDRQTFEHEGQQLPAIRWLADVIARPQVAMNYKVFRIDHPDVLALLDVQQGDQKRFPFNLMLEHAEALSSEAAKAAQVEAQHRNVFQKHMLELWGHLTLFGQLMSREAPYAIPPLEEGEEWRPFVQAHAQAEQTGRTSPALIAYDAIWEAYHDDKAATFNEAVAQYQALLDEALPQASRKADFEVFFNRFAPFYKATVLYLIAFLLGCFSLLATNASSPKWAQTLQRAMFYLLVFIFVLHTFGLGARIYLQGRPPVTNLYSSAVFIGWGAVLFAILVERFTKLGLAGIVASFVGFVTLIIAHNLADGDTMEMMQAVLDSNFWLATHVIVVTAGYSATYLAGFFAIAFILLGVFTRLLTPEVRKSLTKVVYGIICFALLFSFTGTVLGGIWADQSWGRFWGWDPKENGALLIVLMNALILHARWGGMIQQRGLMNLAVAGNMITAWSWFGTNMLGVGLHSYGFIDSAMFWLILFWASQLGIIALGLLPLQAWRSYAQEAEGKAVTASGGAGNAAQASPHPTGAR